MTRLHLNSAVWTLTGWQPHNWDMFTTMETGVSNRIEVGPLPIKVPGSVQQALRDAEVIPDWRDGLQARTCEWVENRHWVLETSIPAGALSGPGPHRLVLAGVDGNATVMLGRRILASVSNTFRPHTIDLGNAIEEAIPLRIIFTDQPRALGQVHRTSQIRDWKSRYPYVWDWSPRVMQVGLWEGVEIVSGPSVTKARALSGISSSGHGTVDVHWESNHCSATDRVIARLYNAADVEIGTAQVHASAGVLRLQDLLVDRWWPNGLGKQPLYRLDITCENTTGDILDRHIRHCGFRTVTWSPCRGAPLGARDWICSVNDRSVFLQGANWVPLRTCFADVTAQEYAERLATYRDLGFNLLRVWGGSVLEKEYFYDLCDQYGLMVWQEFPLSSSGIDNHPPDDPALVADMENIAEHYIIARQHHAALMMWCGGNELQRAADGGPGIGRPCDEREPMLAAQAAVCARLDSTRRFVPTSASGPRFTAEQSDFGKGLHHDVHGPWGWSGDLAGWQAYWQADDALIRTEAGFPGAQSADLTRRHGGSMAWPAQRENPYWGVNSGWWIQWDEFTREHPAPANLDMFVAWSQARQAEFLALAARSCKSRFPACGGFIVWMGHDCFPCPTNTSVIDVMGRPKPAGLALATVFKDQGVR